MRATATAQASGLEETGLFREVFANSTEAIAVIDAEGHYVEQNAAHRELTGFSDEDLRGRTPAVHFGEATFQEIAQALARDGRLHGEFRSRRKDGTLIDIELSAFTVRDGEGRPRFHVGIKRDVTAKKAMARQLEQRVMELESLHRLTERLSAATTMTAVYDAALDCIQRALDTDRCSILLLDAQGVMRFEAWRGLSDGYRAAVEGHSPWPNDATDPKPVVIEDVAQAEIEASLRTTVMDEGIAALAFIPLMHRGRLLGKFMVYHKRPRAFAPSDLRLAETTAGHIASSIVRRRAEEALDEARRQVALTEKLSAMGTLVSGVAHEIRTPLAYVTNSVYLMLARAERAASGHEPPDAWVKDVRQFGRDALEGAERINRIVMDLRRFTRRNAGDRVRVALHEVVAEAVSLFRATHRGRVLVLAHLEPTAPIEVDKVQVQQVVLNLLENASEAMPHGGAIRVATRPTEEGAQIEVSDTGVGIPPEVQARMFDPLFTTKPEGTGLGLSITKRIVEEHGGRIRFTTNAGAGTTFVVSLPESRGALLHEGLSTPAPT